MSRASLTTCAAAESRSLTPRAVLLPTAALPANPAAWDRDLTLQESGIREHRLRLMVNGTEMATGSLPGGRAGASPYSFDGLPELRNGSNLQVHVVGINRVGIESVVVESPPFTLLLASINLEDPWFVRELQPGSPGGLPISEYLDDEAASVGFRLATDPMYPSSEFEYTWALVDAPCDDEDNSVLLTRRVHVDRGLATHSHIHRWRPSPTTNDMLLPSPGRRASERDAIWAKSFATDGLAPGAVCALVTACTQAIYAPDGSLVLEARCKNATSAPATLETTPPVATVERLASVNSSGSAFPMQVGLGCVDNESSVGEVWLSLGTEYRPSLLLEELQFNVTVDENGTYVELAAANVSGVDGLFVTSSTPDGFQAVLLVSDALFVSSSMALDGALIATLVCVNQRGMVSTVTSDRTFVDVEPPSRGLVSFPSLVWSAEHGAFLGAEADATNLTVAWSGFNDAALHGYSICMSLSEDDGCTVESLELSSTITTTVLQNLLTAVRENAPGASSTSVAVTVEAIDLTGFATSTNVVLLFDRTPPEIGNLTARMLTPTERPGPLNPQQGSVLHDTVLKLELAGGAFDDDLDEPLAIRWQVAAADGRPVRCTYDGLPAVNGTWAWAAHCNVQNASELCFTARAVSVVDLSSRPAEACITLHLGAPVWTEPPVLTRAEDDQMNITWALPHEHLSGAPLVFWALCSHLGCGEQRLVERGQTSVLLALYGEPITHGYTGEVWAVMSAAPSAALRRASSIESNRLRIGAVAPTAGTLTLGSSSGAARLASLSDAVLALAGFDEPVHGVSSFVWCVGTALAADDLMPCRTTSRVPRRIVFAELSNAVWPSMNETRTAVVTATACNVFGQCQTSGSNRILVDADQPSGGFVRDGLRMTDDDWQDVLVLSCVEGVCTTSPLLTGRESDILRENTIAPMRVHVDAAADASLGDPRLLQYGPTTLAASWGGFADASSSLGSAQLCFGAVGAAVHACAVVPPSGLAVAIVPVEDTLTYHATITVADIVGRNATLRSEGVQVLTSPPTPSTVTVTLPTRAGASNQSASTQVETLGQRWQHASYSPDCNALQVEWAAFTTQGCESNTSYTWQVCDGLGGCNAPLAIPHGALVAETQSARLVPGRAYVSRITATGCSGTSSSAVSRSVVCDDTAPVVQGVPSLATLTGDAIAPNIEAYVRVAWAGVFADGESLIRQYEVCLVRGGGSCPAGGFHTTGTNTSAVLEVPTVEAATTSFSAVVRATNRAGLLALATSESIDVDHWAPAVGRLAVDGFVRGEGQSCLLNRSSHILVRWQSSDEGSGLRSHEVTVHELTAQDGAEGEGTVVTVGGANAREAVVVDLNTTARTVRIRATARDHATLSSSDFIDCTVDLGRPPQVEKRARGCRKEGEGGRVVVSCSRLCIRAPVPVPAPVAVGNRNYNTTCMTCPSTRLDSPQVAQFWVEGAVELSPHTFAIDPFVFPSRRICWSEPNLGDPPLLAYRIWSSRGSPAGSSFLRASSSGTLNEVCGDCPCTLLPSHTPLASPQHPSTPAPQHPRG